MPLFGGRMIIVEIFERGGGTAGRRHHKARPGVATL